MYRLVKRKPDSGVGEDVSDFVPSDLLRQNRTVAFGEDGGASDRRLLTLAPRCDLILLISVCSVLQKFKSGLQAVRTSRNKADRTYVNLIHLS